MTTLPYRKHEQDPGSKSSGQNSHYNNAAW